MHRPGPAPSDARSGLHAVTAPVVFTPDLTPASAKRQIASGGLWTTATWLATAATGPAMTVILVRGMAPTAFGGLAIATSLIGLLAILSGFGLDPTVARYAAAWQASMGSRALLAARASGMRIACWAAAVSVPLLLVSLVVSRQIAATRPAWAAIAVMSAVVLVMPFKNVLGGLLRAGQRPAVLSVATLSGSVVFAALVITGAVSHHLSAPYVASAVSLETLTVVAIRYRGSRRITRERINSSRALRPVVLFGASMVLTGCFGVAIAELDVLVLGIARGAHVVAGYAPASMVANGVMGMPALIGGFFLPAAARAVARGDDAEVRHLYHWASKWSLVLCAPLVVLMIVDPAGVLNVLFGTRTIGDATALRVLGVGVAGQVLFGFNGLTMDAYGLPGAVAVRQVVSLAASGLLCLTLAPTFGAVGAAWATACSLILSNIWNSRSLARRFAIAPWDARLAWVAGAVGLAGLGAWAAGSLVGDNVLRCLVEAGVVGAVAVVVAVCASDLTERRAIWYEWSRTVRRVTHQGG
jgi:O-antigen/teichoic acid export membrane protein